MERLIAAIVAAPLQLFLVGWMISTMWGWFVAPVFDLPSLTIWTGLGIALVWGCLTTRYQEHDDDAFWARLLFGVVAPPCCVGVGWLIHSLGEFPS